MTVESPFPSRVRHRRNSSHRSMPACSGLVRATTPSSKAISETAPSLFPILTPICFSVLKKWLAGAGGNHPEVDGVVALDLTAIAAVLDATGPIESPVYGTVTGDQIGQILLIDAYAEFGQDDAVARHQANQQLDELLRRILSGDDLVNTVQAIASTAPGRHFQVWMGQGLEQLALDAVRPAWLRHRSGDWSAMYTEWKSVRSRRLPTAQPTHRCESFRRWRCPVRQQLTLTNATPVAGRRSADRVGYETSWLKNAYILWSPGRHGTIASITRRISTYPFSGHGRRDPVGVDR